MYELKANRFDPDVVSVLRPYRPSASGRNKFHPSVVAIGATSRL